MIQADGSSRGLCGTIQLNAGEDTGDPCDTRPRQPVTPSIMGNLRRNLDAHAVAKLGGGLRGGAKPEIHGQNR